MRTRNRKWLSPLALALLAAACSTDDGWTPQAQPAEQAAAPPEDAAAPAAAPAPGTGDVPPEVRAALAAGYLHGQAPSSLTLLPPPPAAGSAAQARDDAAAKAAAALREGPRWKQAAQDADLKFPAVAGTFACALDVEISESSTPKLCRLMQRTMADIGLSTYPTKMKFQRTRPFVASATPTCTPADEAFLRRDGSYPSGHSAIGWGWALVLAEAAPDRIDAVLARGRAFGQSRVVCNVHWLSDTEEGRVMASATVAALHEQAEFRADLDAARAEIQAARSAGRRPARNCEMEAMQLAAN